MRTFDRLDRPPPPLPLAHEPNRRRSEPTVRSAVPDAKAETRPAANAKAAWHRGTVGYIEYWGIFNRSPSRNADWCATMPGTVMFKAAMISTAGLRSSSTAATKSCIR